MSTVGYYYKVYCRCLLQCLLYKTPEGQSCTHVYRGLYITDFLLEAFATVENHDW